MSVKKLLTLSVVGLAALGASTAMAGGPEYIPPPSYEGVYLELNAGYAYRDWVNTADSPFEGVDTDSNRLRGGFSGIVDLGYQFNEFLSLEIGWIYLPRPSFDDETSIVLDDVVTTFDFDSHVHTWAAYLAGKLTVPVWENTFLFGKLGAAFVDNDLDASLTVTTDGVSTSVSADASRDYWQPIFMFGIQYYFNPNWSINFQYTRLPGNHHISSSFTVPDADIWTLGIGYKFLT